VNKEIHKATYIISELQPVILKSKILSELIISPSRAYRNISVNICFLNKSFDNFTIHLMDDEDIDGKLEFVKYILELDSDGFEKQFKELQCRI